MILYLWAFPNQQHGRFIYIYTKAITDIGRI